jgi:hypothetical protein
MIAKKLPRKLKKKIKLKLKSELENKKGYKVKIKIIDADQFNLRFTFDSRTFLKKKLTKWTKNK